MPLFVLTGNGKSLQRSAFHFGSWFKSVLTFSNDQAAGGMFKVNSNGWSFDFDRLKQWTAGHDIFLCNIPQRPQRQSMPNVLFVARMDIVGGSNVRDDSHAGVRNR